MSEEPRKSFAMNLPGMCIPYCEDCGQYHYKNTGGCPPLLFVTPGTTSEFEHDPLIDRLTKTIQSLQELRDELQRKGGM